MQALLKHDFKVPQALRRKTNVAGTKCYDQIAFKTKPDVLEHVDRQSDDALRRNAGVFKLFGSEFKWDEHEAHGLATSALHGSQYGGDHVKSFRDWRTYQMSDHNPLWARLAVNGADSYLARLRAE
jgi:hypothetical protein